MEQKKSLNYYMRSLHRDIGFFVIGFVFIYALSGILLTYRDTGLLKHEVVSEKSLEAGIDPSQLGELLRIRGLQITGTEGSLVMFENGSYDSSTGKAKYTSMETYPAIEKLYSVHKASSSNPVHWINVVFGISLLFLGISSFWMFKKGSEQFRRGIYISVAGIAIALLLVYL
jgi:hypothetical protein